MASGPRALICLIFFVLRGAFAASVEELEADSLFPTPTSCLAFGDQQGRHLLPSFLYPKFARIRHTSVPRPSLFGWKSPGPLERLSAAAESSVLCR